MEMDKWLLNLNSSDFKAPDLSSCHGRQNKMLVDLLYRESNGDLEKLNDLSRVIGTSEKQN